MGFFEAAREWRIHKSIGARCRAVALSIGLMGLSVAPVHAMTLQEALTSSQYAVSSCDINRDGQPDYLVKSVPTTILIPLDDDLSIPIVIPPKGPNFLIQSFAGANFSVVQNPDNIVQGDACWTPAAYSTKAGDGKVAPTGTLYVFSTQGTGLGFVIGVESGTQDLKLVGIKRPPVLTDPSAASAPSGSISASAKTQTRTVSYEYEEDTGLLSKQILEPNNPQVRVELSVSYDSWGNVSTSTTSSPAGGSAMVVPRVSRSQYDGRGQFLLSTTNAEGHTDNVEYDRRYGAPRVYTDPNAAAMRWEYDSFGRASRTVAADGTAVSFEYAYCSATVACPGRAKYRITQTPVNAAGGINGPWTRQYFDELDRSVATETAGFDAGSVISATQVYDDLGRVRQTTRPAFQGQSQAATTYAYDILGRPVSVTGPDGAVSSIEYSGLQTIARDPLNKARTTIKDSQGRIAKVIDPVGATITYEYDPFGNLAQTTDSANNATRMTYDIRGNKTAMLAPNLGYWEYEYDAFGQLVRQKDGRGQTSSFVYDRLGRMLTSIEPDLTANWAYDNCVKGIGSLCTESSPSGFARTYSYDALGRLSGTSVMIDNVSYATSVGYDADGRVATLGYPNGFAIKYVYSALGDLAEVRNNASNALYWQASQRDALGRMTSQRFGNGLVTGQEFEPLSGRIKNIFAGASKNVQNLNYQFDLAGNLLARSDATQSMSESFAFDSAGRLTDAQLNSPAVTSRQNFAYDAIGNVQTRSDLGTYTYGSALHPHAVTSVAMADGRSRNYTYDAVGNVTRIQQVDSQGTEILKDSLTLTYTSFNGVRTIVDGTGTNTLGLAYGTGHERIMQQSAEGLRVYVHPDNAGGLLYEKLVKPTGGVEHDYYVAAEGQTVAIIKQEGSTLTPVYTHQDFLGSTVAVTDANGIVNERFSYDVFGKRRLSNGTVDPANTVQGTNTHRGYTFHEHADTFGLINMNGRFYDPVIGRFLAADPGVPYGDDPQSFNRYAYGRNSPLRNVDFSGFDDDQAASQATGSGASSLQEDGTAIRDSQGNTLKSRHWEILDSNGNMKIGGTIGTRQGFPITVENFIIKNYEKISSVMTNGMTGGRTLSSSSANSGYAGAKSGGSVASSDASRQAFAQGFVSGDNGPVMDPYYGSRKDGAEIGEKVGLAVEVAGVFALPVKAIGWVKGLFALKGAETAAVVSSGAESALAAANLSKHLTYSQKYGQTGFKALENGRIRYYGELQSASKPGEMAGRRWVHEFNPASGNSRGWHEVLDHSGNVRQVRPEWNNGTKTHFMFDTDGNFIRKW